MSEIEQLKKRVAELEAEVARLKASPPGQYHYHYHPPYSPLPANPLPTYPQWPTVWCGPQASYEAR